MDRQGRSIPLGRETVGLVLLAGLLLTGLLSSWDMGKTHRDISGYLEDAAWFALGSDWENARIAAAAAEDRWESHRDLSSLLADHTPMEEIDALFAKVNICSAARRKEDFAVLCAELSRKMEAMGEAHQLSWQNLL